MNRYIFHVMFDLGDSDKVKTKSISATTWKESLTKTVEWMNRMNEKYGKEFNVHQMHGAP